MYLEFTAQQAETIQRETMDFYKEYVGKEIWNITAQCKVCGECVVDGRKRYVWIVQMPASVPTMFITNGWDVIVDDADYYSDRDFYDNLKKAA